MQGTVTALRLQRNGRRVNVFLNAEYAFALTRILAERLRIGQVLDADAIEKLQQDNRLEEARQRCIGKIARRPRSVDEIRRTLRTCKLASREADAVLQRLMETGLLNDREFARAWVDNRQDLRPRSKRALRMELRSKGVGADDMEPALAGVDDRKAADAAAGARASRWKLLPEQDFTKKMLAFLAVRGFDYETSREAARSAWQKCQDDILREEENSNGESEDG